MPDDNKSVHLVLDGGGAEGIGLLGAVSTLYDAGYRFQRIAGTSAGAFVAALVAAYQRGKWDLHDLEEKMHPVDYPRFADALLEGLTGRLGVGVELLHEGAHNGNYLKSAAPVAVDMTYDSYLRLGEVLGAQDPRTSDADGHELHFIITHQAIELSFKQVIRDLSLACEHASSQRFAEILPPLQRVHSVLRAVLAQMQALHHLPPLAFATFRPYLGTASGSQSTQFREIEVLAGLRDAGYLQGLRDLHGGELPPSIADRLASPSLAETIERSVTALGAASWADVYRHPHRGLGYVVAEALVEFDMLWLQWRTDHMAMVERFLGLGLPGTHGWSRNQLRRTLDYRFFPFLWRARIGAPEEGPLPESKPTTSEIADEQQGEQ